MEAHGHEEIEHEIIDFFNSSLKKYKNRRVSGPDKENFSSSFYLGNWLTDFSQLFATDAYYSILSNYQGFARNYNGKVDKVFDDFLIKKDGLANIIRKVLLETLNVEEGKKGEEIKDDAINRKAQSIRIKRALKKLGIEEEETNEIIDDITINNSTKAIQKKLKKFSKEEKIEYLKEIENNTINEFYQLSIDVKDFSTQNLQNAQKTFKWLKNKTKKILEDLFNILIIKVGEIFPDAKNIIDYIKSININDIWNEFLEFIGNSIEKITEVYEFYKNKIIEWVLDIVNTASEFIDENYLDFKNLIKFSDKVTCRVSDKEFQFDKRDDMWGMARSCIRFAGYVKFVNKKKLPLDTFEHILDNFIETETANYKGVKPGFENAPQRFNFKLNQYYPTDHLDRAFSIEELDKAVDIKSTRKASLISRDLNKDDKIYSYLETQIEVAAGKLTDLTYNWIVPQYVENKRFAANDLYLNAAKLGNSLHMVEDYFAHTNAIELVVDNLNNIKHPNINNSDFTNKEELLNWMGDGAFFSFKRWLYLGDHEEFNRFEKALNMAQPFNGKPNEYYEAKKETNLVSGFFAENDMGTSIVYHALLGKIFEFVSNVSYGKAFTIKDQIALFIIEQAGFAKKIKKRKNKIDKEIRGSKKQVDKSQGGNENPTIEKPEFMDKESMSEALDNVLITRLFTLLRTAGEDWWSAFTDFRKETYNIYNKDNEYFNDAAINYIFQSDDLGLDTEISDNDKLEIKKILNSVFHFVINTFGFADDAFDLAKSSIELVNLTFQTFKLIMGYVVMFLSIFTGNFAALASEFVYVFIDYIAVALGNVYVAAKQSILTTVVQKLVIEFWNGTIDSLIANSWLELDQPWRYGSHGILAKDDPMHNRHLSKAALNSAIFMDKTIITAMLGHTSKDEDGKLKLPNIQELLKTMLQNPKNQKRRVSTGKYEPTPPKYMDLCIFPDKLDISVVQAFNHFISFSNLSRNNKYTIEQLKLIFIKYNSFIDYKDLENYASPLKLQNTYDKYNYTTSSKSPFNNQTQYVELPKTKWGDTDNSDFDPPSLEDLYNEDNFNTSSTPNSEQENPFLVFPQIEVKDARYLAEFYSTSTKPIISVAEVEISSKPNTNHWLHLLFYKQTDNPYPRLVIKDDIVNALLDNVVLTPLFLDEPEEKEAYIFWIKDNWIDDENLSPLQNHFNKHFMEFEQAPADIPEKEATEFIDAYKNKEVEMKLKYEEFIKKYVDLTVEREN